MSNAAEIWPAVQAELRAEVPEADYERWLAPLRPSSFTDGLLVVEAPRAIRGWVSDRFAGTLERAVLAVLGNHARVEIAGHTAGDRLPTGRAASRPDRHVAPTLPAGSGRSELNPKFSFDQFILGPGNRFAHAASLAVAELPAQAYNPLFLFGPPGVGKTHLLHSIGNYVQIYGGGLTVRCTTAEAFTNAFLGALHGGDVDRFKERFRGVDLLLMDDVQFLESKARTEEEFFHTFNTLHDAGGQVVLTSDRLPGDLDALEERLRERFESGLVADIAAPDFGTRMAVLRKRVHHDGIEVVDEALEVIAERIPTNMRALEGALIRVVAYHSLTGRPLDASLAEEVLAGLYPAARDGTPATRRSPPLTVETIQAATCEAFGITRAELLSESRSQRVTWPRQVAMYLAREHTGQSLPAIARAFGGRNHTTVMHACKRAAQRLDADPDASETVRTLAERIHADRRD